MTLAPSPPAVTGPDGGAPTPGRRRRWRRRLLWAVPLVIVAYLGVTLVQVWMASHWDRTGRADAAVVLGAAQYDGRPSPALSRRLDHALDLWRRGLAPTIVLTGSKQPGDRFTEAYAGFTYLRERGVPERDLVIVDDGTSTWESLAASGRVLRARGVRTVLLVSDPYHSLRLSNIASEVGIDGRVSPTSTRSSSKPLLREALLVAGGRIVGYRRLVELIG